MQCLCVMVAGYSFPQCTDGVMTVLETQTAPIRCEGLGAGENIYWTIAQKGSHLSTTFANCSACSSTTSCPNCQSSYAEHYAVTRSVTHSELTIMNNVRRRAGGTIKCSSKDNRNWVTCGIRTVCEYHLYTHPSSCTHAVCG